MIKSMIGYIEGEIKAMRPSHCVVLTGGLGYKVFTTKDALLRYSPGVRAELWIHMAVREDAQDLYGFVMEEELRFFELLLTVSGIGPKSALAVLDAVSIETLHSAISQNRAEYLTKVSGIGKKTAEKIVLELKDKVSTIAEGIALKGDEEALEALRALGYSSTEARDTLRKVPSQFSNSNDRLREALKLLGTRA
jgi:holliday junction DNA helicase RuvA